MIEINAAGSLFALGVKSLFVERAGETMNAIATTAERAKASLVGTAHIPGNLGNTAATGVQTAIADMVRNWMLNHPISGWFVAHPVVTLVLVLVLLVLVRGLLGAIGRLTEQIWLTILRLPITFTQWVFTLGAGLFNRSALSSQPEQPSSQQQLATLLDRLETLKLEQDELIKQVRAILNSEQRSM